MTDPTVSKNATVSLKPCPFCGSSDLHIYVMQDGIRCDNCGAKFTDCEDWMEKWNRRVGD